MPGSRRRSPARPHACTQILRAEQSAQDRDAFLRERRAVLEQRVASLSRAMDVLDEKIAYHG
ncbi:hypothetical protein ABZZ79_05780 [Streptomyces sp. NPDC006458]|uniref:hypothetical protein n=1 Tax=Streptomyces sp. NPDC006458 TaxID=3154302 RepID=UPI0033AE76A6